MSRSALAWGVEHIRRRHGDTDVAVLYVEVGKNKLVSCRCGLFYTDCDVPPAKVLGELAWEG